MEQLACTFMEGLTCTSREACLTFEINGSTLSNFKTLITDELPPSLSQAGWALQMKFIREALTLCHEVQKQCPGFLNSFS